MELFESNGSIGRNANEGSRLKQLREMLDQTRKSLGLFTHPRVSVAWQDLNLVFRRVYNPSADLPVNIVGRRIEDFLEDEVHARELTALKQNIMLTRKPYQEVIPVMLSGHKHIFDVNIEPTYDEAGKMDGLITITIDVTDLEEARMRLDEANQRLVKLLDEALGDGPVSRRKRPDASMH